MSELLIESPIQAVVDRLVFSEPVLKSTRAGERLMRSAPIEGAIKGPFWDSYNKHKAEWIGRGFSVGKWGAGWSVTQWLNTDGTITRQAREMAAAELGASAEERASLPAIWEPDDVTLESPQSAILYGWQRSGALRLKRALMSLPAPESAPLYQSVRVHGGGNGCALDASGTGTGKTIAALVVAAELGMTPCIIAPLAVLPAWQRAAQMVGIRLGWCINYQKIRNGRSGLGKFKMDEVFVYEYLPGKRPLLIFDELQACKAEATLNSKLLRSAVAAKLPVLGLSATAAKDPTEMRALGYMLGLHDGSLIGWKAWCKLNGCAESKWGLKYQERKNKKALEKLHRQIFPLRGNRIRVEDVPEFPETQILAEVLDTGNTDDIQAGYDEAEAAILQIQGNSSLDGRQKAASTLAEIMKARIRAEKGKLDLFVSMAEDAIEEDESVVIFVNFRAHVQELGERLKTKCLIWGEQKPEVRQQNIDDFQSDKQRICIVSLQAGGAGLSLHDVTGVHPRLAIISPSYSAVDLKQSLGRVNRAGGKSKSRQRIVLASGTVEEQIAVALREKLSNIDTLNDGSLSPPSFLAPVCDEINGVIL